MYIQRVYLKDLRGFGELDFSLTRPDGSYAGWTVLTGDNGSGKTALLKAIALALVGPDVARALQPTLSGWIRMGSREAEIAVQLVVHEMDRFVTGRRPRRLWSEIDLQMNGGPEVSLNPGARRRKSKKGPFNGPWAENTPGWFAVGYGPFRRLYGASPEAQRLMSGPSRVSRFATMFKEDATLLECELWLKDLNYRKLEDRPQEARVLKQTVSLLNDDFLRNGIRVEKIDSEGLWLHDASDTTLPLSEMSEGYRAALALMIDIMRHVVKTYPEADLAESNNGHLTVPHEGVVLIDEIDAHLHPEWQRKIGYWLKTRFPNMQFIVTSHSATGIPGSGRGCGNTSRAQALRAAAEPAYSPRNSARQRRVPGSKTSSKWGLPTYAGWRTIAAFSPAESHCWLSTVACPSPGALARAWRRGRRRSSRSPVKRSRRSPLRSPISTARWGVSLPACCNR